MASTNTSLGATTFSEEDCRAILDQLLKRFTDSSTTGPKVGGTKLWDRVRTRRAHLFCDPSVDPELPEPWDKGRKFQSHDLWFKFNELTQRLLQNHWVAQSNPIRNTPTMTTIRDKVDAYLNQSFNQYEQKRGISLQGALANGQTADCYGIITWRRNFDVIPDVPDEEWADELPSDLQEQKRFYPKRRRRPDGKLAYQETGDSLRNRHDQAKATAGLPWTIETPSADEVAFVWDSFGIAMAAWVRTVGYLDFKGDVEKATGGAISLSLNEADSRVRVYTEQRAPAAQDPSGQHWGKRLAIAELWTRDECYMLCSPQVFDQDVVSALTDWQLVRSFKHPYNRVPFAIAPATEFNHPDPQYRYLPALHAMYMVKPAYDRMRSYLDVLAMTSARGYYVVEDAGNAAPSFDENGDPEEIGSDPSNTAILPAGKKIVELRPEVAQAFVNYVGASHTELIDAAPATGVADISGGARPWAIRLAQQQANIGPSQMLSTIDTCLNVMLTNIAYVNGLPAEQGGVGESLTIALPDKAGNLNMNDLITIEPDDWNKVTIGVVTNATSAQEVITKQEHGRELLGDANVKMPLERYLKDYMDIEDPAEWVKQWYGEQFFNQKMLPPLMDLEFKKWFSSKAFMGVNGADLNAAGQSVDPYTIAAGNGFVDAATGRPPVAPPPPQVTQSQPGQVAVAGQQSAMPTRMPSMPASNVPGAVSIPGLPG